ncbi:hypothetical protein TNIN_125471 [Trichonephila inaurata madagascariensis]|uniref:C2H2-type domain-containing protein n=1 Tax=Trichonephila inaurata madagascariensis TaxID=2747483 RepID=A0A8X7C9R4_9ARAC|nr:hypothetical protein TNIN_125471 [Trichonephila inaurata madagascariensis]
MTPLFAILSPNPTSHDLPATAALHPSSPVACLEAVTSPNAATASPAVPLPPATALPVDLPPPTSLERSSQIHPVRPASAPLVLYPLASRIEKPPSSSIIKCCYCDKNFKTQKGLNSHLVQSRRYCVASRKKRISFSSRALIASPTIPESTQVTPSDSVSSWYPLHPSLLLH